MFYISLLLIFNTHTGGAGSAEQVHRQVQGADDDRAHGGKMEDPPRGAPRLLTANFNVEARSRAQDRQLEQAAALLKSKYHIQQKILPDKNLRPDIQIH